MKIYCDMDGTIVDFDKGVYQLTGRWPHEIEDRYMWTIIAKVKTFYRDLEWLPDGKELWNYIKSYNPTILTGKPRAFDAQECKRIWCAKELGENIPVIICFSKEKQNFCSPGDILIDDRVDIGERWIAAGGKFILHNSADESIMYLQDLGI